MVEVVVVSFLLEDGVGAPYAIGTPAVGFLCCAGGCVFSDQPFIGVDVECCLCAYLFLDSSAERIVCVGGGAAIRELYIGQPVGGVVGVGGCLAV